MNEHDLLHELRLSSEARDAAGGGSWRRWAIVAAVVLLAGVLAAWFWRGGSAPLEVTAVTALAPAQAASEAVLQATGYVTARRQATVSAQIVGTLVEVLIEEGDRVAEGQVLARLDDSSQLAYLNSAKASLGAAEAQAAQVRTQLAQAERDRTRQEELAARKLAPQQQAEQAATQVDSLRAQLRAVEAQARAAAAQVAVAQVNYDYTVVRAPFAGVITQKAAQVGEIIAPAAAGGGFTRTGVGTIVDMDSLEIDVDVNEAYIGRVSGDMPSEAILDAYPDWRIPGHVIAIVPTADRGKATVKVRVGLDQKDPRIVPDMGVRVSFLEREPEQAEDAPAGVFVPASAITERDGRSVVFTLEDGQARLRAVSLEEESASGMRRVASGLDVGATVIDRPPPELADGTPAARRTRK